MVLEIGSHVKDNALDAQYQNYIFLNVRIQTFMCIFVNRSVVN